MSLTLKSKATTSERSIGGTDIAISMLAMTHLPQLSVSVRPRTTALRGYSRTLDQARIGLLNSRLGRLARALVLSELARSEPLLSSYRRIGYNCS
jgi:hypothetical protein